jgi:hypothetical protein
MRPSSSAPAALAALVIGAAALEFAACTGEASFTLPAVDAGVPSTRYEAVCTAWARRACAPGEACPRTFIAGWENDDQCVARETLACELQADDPEVPFDPATVDACTFAAGCPGGAVVHDAPYSSTLCLPPGKAPMGAPCVWNSACESGACLYPYASDGSIAACGTCQSPLRCSCASNQECVFYPDHATCVTLPDAGEKCGAPLYACNDSQCVTSGDGEHGTCQALPGASLGMPCTADLTGPQCVSTASSVYCDVTGHCQAYVAARYGEPCVVGNGGEGNVCVGGGWCDSDSTRVCQPPAPDGEPCEDDVLPCLPPARCLQGACVFPSLATCGL